MTAYSFQPQPSRKRFVRKVSTARNRQERWGVILAGGDGTRLRSMTRAISGDDRPKQFGPIIDGSTLLDQTRRRVALSVLPARTLLVVTEEHRRFYQPIANAMSQDLLLEQPENKGTAPAIIYALMQVAAQSPNAIVGLFPSDHYFADDEAFMSYVDTAFDAVQAAPETATLLGITPEGPEIEYGWIEPEVSILGSLPRSISRVRRFWEKPTADVARKLLRQGCLWNSFVMIDRVDALLKMTEHALPDLFKFFAGIVPTFGMIAERNALRELYAKISETNFSHRVLAMRPNDLAVMRVGEVGWSDLGEPARVLSTLARMGVETQFAMSAS